MRDPGPDRSLPAAGVTPHHRVEKQVVAVSVAVLLLLPINHNNIILG